MDAQVSYAFHSERKLYPEKFKKQIANQVSTVIDMTLIISINGKIQYIHSSIPSSLRKPANSQNTYLKLGCTQGWFCASLMHDSSRYQYITIYIKKCLWFIPSMLI